MEVDQTRKTTGATSTYTAAKTPMAHQDGAKTPMYEDQDHSRTPMYEQGKTPNPYADGSRTPLYGAMTPRQDGGQSTWDPNITNTPALDMTPNPYNTPGPHTPGGLAHGSTGYEPSPAASPMGGSGSYPQTPMGGAMTPAMNYQPFSPAFAGDQNVTSPMSASFAPTSPVAQNQSPAYSASPMGTGYQPSPVGMGGAVQSPHGSGSYVAPSPFAAYSPASGSASGSNYSPSTGSLNPASNQYGAMPGDMIDWYTTDIWVTIKTSFETKDLHNQQGVIKSVQGSLCNVLVPSVDKVISIQGQHLLQVMPAKDDKVKVLTDDDREALGTLISIDGFDGIVRMDFDKQLKILQLRYLGKLAENVG